MLYEEFQSTPSVGIWVANSSTMTQLVNAYSQKGSFSLENRFPYEILSFIFTLAADAADRLPCPSKRQCSLAISHVSQLWRQIALDLPNLWTQLSPLPSPFVNTLLSRSGQAPLDIHVGSTISSYSEFLAQVLHHQPRWRLFHVELSERGLWDAIEGLPEHLETLRVERPDRATWNRPNLNIPSHGFPQLRELGLRGVRLPLSSLIRNSLRKLSLASVSPLDRDFIYSLLRSSPRLEELIFRDLPNAQFESNRLPPVQLPCLRILQLDVETYDEFTQPQPQNICCSILGLIIAPPSLQLHMSAPLSIHRRFGSLFPTLSEIQSNLPNLSRVRTLELKISNGDAVRMGIDIEGYGMNNEKVFSFRYRQAFAEALFEDLGRVFPMPSLEKVSLTLSPHVDTKIVVDFLARHPTITDLSFRGCTGPIEALLLIPTQPVLCPSLTKLSLSGCFIKTNMLIAIFKSRIQKDVKGDNGAPLSQNVARLEYLTICNVHFITAKEILALEELVTVIQL